MPLKDPIALGLFGVFLAIGFPIPGGGGKPLLLAAFLVGAINRIVFELISLPNGFLCFLANFLFTSSLVFVPGAGIKKIATINTRDLFHVHHHDGFNEIKSIMVKQNGPELKELNVFFYGGIKKELDWIW